MQEEEKQLIVLRNSEEAASDGKFTKLACAYESDALVPAAAPEGITTAFTVSYS